MSDIKNQLNYVTKPYNVVGKVSIFPLNEDGVKNYIQNRIVENKIIKRYGTMNFLEKSENIFTKEEINGNILNGNERIKNLKNEEHTKNVQYSNIFSNPTNKGKTLSNWKEEFFHLKRKFKDDINAIDLKIKTLKNENKSNNTNHESNSQNHKKYLSCSEKKNILNEKLKYHGDYSQNKKNIKLLNEFSSNKVPRINSVNDILNIQNSFKQFLKEKYDSDSITKNFRASTSDIPSKIIDNWVSEENQKFKNLFSRFGPRDKKIKIPGLSNKIIQPEIIFTRNIKGDCKMMGDNYNPYNYYVDYTRHRKKRNFYGSIYNN